MNILGRMVKNTIALLIADLLSKALNFVFIAILVRQLTPADYGGYTTIMSLVLFLGPLADLGLSQVLIREVAADREKASALFSNAVFVTGGLSIVAGLALLVIARLARYPNDLRPLIMISAFAVIANTLTQTAGAVLRGLERMEIQAALTSVLLLVSSITGIILALTGFGLPAQILAYTILALTGAGLTLRFLHRNFVPLIWKINIPLCRQLIIMALPITLLIAYSVFLRWSDILILGQVRSMEEVAVYGAAQKTIDLAMVIITSVTGALLPVLSSQWRQSTEATQKIYFSSLRFYVAFGIAAAIGMTILSESIAVTLFGEAYQVAALPLQILAWAFFFAVVSGPMGTMLLASGDYLNKVLIPMGAIAAGNVILNLIFAPQWGYLGSAVIFLLTAFATFVVRQWASQFFLGRTYPLIPYLARPVIAGIGMGLALWGLRTTHLLISVPIGAAIFVLLLAVLGEFKQEPYRSLISLISSRLPARKQT